MSFDSLMRHRLVRIRQVAVLAMGQPTYDDYGQPITVADETSGFPGLIQPLNAKEVAQFSQAGAAVFDHKIYTRPRDIRTADALRLTPDDGRRFHVTGIEDEGGQGHHLKLFAKLVTTGAMPAAEGS